MSGPAWMPAGMACRLCTKVPTCGGVICRRRRPDGSVGGCGEGVCWRCMKRAPREKFGKVTWKRIGAWSGSESHLCGMFDEYWFEAAWLFPSRCERRRRNSNRSRRTLQRKTQVPVKSFTDQHFIFAHVGCGTSSC